MARRSYRSSCSAYGLRQRNMQKGAARYRARQAQKDIPVDHSPGLMGFLIIALLVVLYLVMAAA